MKIAAVASVLALAAAVPAAAAEISTHALDLARGVGGRDLPVILAMRAADGGWRQVAAARTDADGRVRRFGDPAALAPGTYRLTFDMSGYPQPGATPFFPEIAITFRVTDPAAHYHVPIAFSPFGYSTYRGN